MDIETTKALIDALANNLEIAIDNRNKITAFEFLFSKQDPALYEEYLETLEKVRRNPPTSISLAGFSKLQEMLSRG